MIDSDFSKHILTRDKFYQAFNLIFEILPDPDKIFKERNYDYTFFKELLKDVFFDGVWEKRLSSILKKNWSFIPTDDSSLSESVAEHFNNKFKKLNLLQLWGDILEANLFGFSCLEVIYSESTFNNKRIWDISEYWGKPQNWFGFDKDNNLVIRNINGGKEELPFFKFILTQYSPTYENPYGKKIASILFWLLVFKKGGWKFFTIFLEKFGGAFASAEIPENRYEDDNFRNQVLNALDMLVTGGVAVFPEKVKVTINESKGKEGAKELFKSYLDEINYNISIRVLGEHLTNVQNSNNRSATEVSNEVRIEKTEIDITLIEPAINKSIEYWSLLNFGIAIPLCEFQFEREQKLSLDIIERDIKLIKNYGVKFKKEYIEEILGLDGDYFDLKEEEENTDNMNKNIPIPKDKEIETKKLSLFKRVISKFSKSKEEKRIVKDYKIMDEYADKKANKFQNSVDRIIDEIINEIDDVTDENIIFEKIINKYPKLNFDEAVSVMDNLKFCASQIGAYSKNVNAKRSFKKKTSEQK